jgi:hypothetical protein
VKRFGNNIAMGCEALGNSILNTTFVNIHDSNDGTARLARHSCHEETDSAGANDKCHGPGRGRSPVYGMDCYGQWFQKRCCIEGNMVWDSEFDVSK